MQMRILVARPGVVGPEHADAQPAERVRLPHSRRNERNAAPASGTTQLTLVEPDARLHRIDDLPDSQSPQDSRPRHRRDRGARA